MKMQTTKMRSSWMMFVVALLILSPVITLAQAQARPGDLLVSSGNQILRFDALNGAYQGALIPNGAQGGLSSANQTVFGPDGSYYVTSTNTNSILRYNGRTGRFAGLFTATPGPTGLTFGPDGDLYVVNNTTNSVMRYNGRNGAFKSFFVPNGRGGLNRPISLVFGPDNNLYVSSRDNDKIARYNGTSGAYMGDFVSPNSGDLDAPHGLTFGRDGNLYVASYNNHRVLRYNGSTGAFMDAFVPAQSGELRNPLSLAFGPDGNLYVSSSGNERILRFNGSTGAFINLFASTSGFGGPLFITFVPPRDSVFTDVGGLGGRATVRVSTDLDYDLIDGTEVKLQRDGQPEIFGDYTFVVSKRYLVTQFSFNNVATGKYDVIITKPNGTQRKIPQSFTIVANGSAEPWVDVIGRNLVRVGVEQTYTISYGNNGNTDAMGVMLIIRGIPANANVRPLFELKNPDLPPDIPPIDWNQIPLVTSDGNEQTIALFLQAIPPGQASTLRVAIKPTSAARFKLSVVITEPDPTGLLGKVTIATCLRNALITAINVIGLIPGAGCITDALIFIFGNLNDTANNWDGLKDHPISDYNTILSGIATVMKCVGKTIGLGEITQILDVALSLRNTILACREAFDHEDQDVDVRTSFDPNEMRGPQGFGTQHWIAGNERLRYQIFFENRPVATAPAAIVTITDQLDRTLVDPYKISLGAISFGLDHTVEPVAGISPISGMSEFDGEIDMRPAQNLAVKINSNVDPDIGNLQWSFLTIDPLTGTLPDDPLAGFLPPNVNPPQGEGNVFFTIYPRPNLTTGTAIRNRASIVFDFNQAIVTNEWVNTIDNDRPLSHVLELPTNTSNATIPVTWTGADTGSGVRNYTIYVSNNGGAYSPWLENVDYNTDNFTGIGGHTYRFYSIARDNVGLAETVKVTPEATITVTMAVANLTIDENPIGGCNTATATVTLNGPAPAGGAVVNINISNGAASVPVSVKVPENQTSAPFPVVANPLLQDMNATLSVTYGGVTKNLNITVRASVTKVSGVVTLKDCVNPLQRINFHFRPINGGTEFTKTVNLLPDGSYTLSNIPCGDYSLGIKGYKWLQKAMSVNTQNGDVSNLNVTLIPGDAQEDNSVDVLDLDLVIRAFDSNISFGDFDPRADFNCDAQVDVLDLDLLFQAFDFEGDP